MSVYQPRGPAFAYPSSVVDMTDPGDPIPWPASTVAMLARALPFAGAARVPRSGVAVSGVLAVTFDVSAHQPPTPDAHRTFYVEPYAYVLVRDTTPLRASTYDPVPGSVTADRDARLLRARNGGIFTATFSEALTTLTFAGGPYELAALVGRVEADRWYFAECDFD